LTFPNLERGRRALARSCPSEYAPIVERKPHRPRTAAVAKLRATGPERRRLGRPLQLVLVGAGQSFQSYPHPHRQEASDALLQISVSDKNELTLSAWGIPTSLTATMFA